MSDEESLKERRQNELETIRARSGGVLTPQDLLDVKARLIGTFLGAFDAGKVHVNPNMPIWPALEKEMLGYRAEMSAQGRAKFEACEGEHDDMLFSLAMAVWYGEEVKRGKRL